MGCQILGSMRRGRYLFLFQLTDRERALRRQLMLPPHEQF